MPPFKISAYKESYKNSPQCNQISSSWPLVLFLPICFICQSIDVPFATWILSKREKLQVNPDMVSLSVCCIPAEVLPWTVNWKE